MLAPGQKPRSSFPRFGLSTYARRFPQNAVDPIFTITINQEHSTEVNLNATDLPSATMQSDFNCVTTWCFESAEWSGVKFVDIYNKYVRSVDRAEAPITGAVLYAQDGYKTSLLLEDLLDKSVMLATSLNGEKLTVEHGAPLRLVAPEHYGYKNLKHLERIEFYSQMPVIKRGIRAFLDHPRARIKKEERGRWVPGWILRYVYRPMIAPTEKEFDKAMSHYKPPGENTSEDA